MKSRWALSSQLQMANDIDWRGCESRSDFQPGMSNGQRAILLDQAELLCEACRITTTRTPGGSVWPTMLVDLYTSEDDEAGRSVTSQRPEFGQSQA